MRVASRWRPSSVAVALVGVAAVAAALLAFNLLLGPAAASADEMARPAAEQVEKAKTKADHTALAESYEQEAKTLDAKADQHKELAKTYSNVGYLKDKWGLVSHCESLADKYRAAARDNRALAKAHRELAARAGDR